MSEEVKHIQVNQRYRIVIERAASTKGVDGFKVEANGDDSAEVLADAHILYKQAIGMTATNDTYISGQK